ncbi:hypothetical protein, partial [Shouchella clausii]|uniref:hypothetical protein n=1 Tax=Shouchella clausii TaxID=79880 RepID=UPI001BB45049
IKLSVKKFDLLIAQPKLWLTMIDEIPCISFTLGFCSVFKGLVLPPFSLGDSINISCFRQ